MLYIWRLEVMAVLIPLVSRGFGFLILPSLRYHHSRRDETSTIGHAFIVHGRDGRFSGYDIGVRQVQPVAEICARKHSACLFLQYHTWLIILSIISNFVSRCTT
jgi:hypothetical protein